MADFRNTDGTLMVIGLIGGLALLSSIADESERLDPKSAAIWGATAGLAIAESPAAPLGLLGAIGYDRWHDRMWPFA